jgi:hypothetical protein
VSGYLTSCLYLRGRTIFAFPSHAHADTTAMSIMHSLLFQLAARDADLQAMLTDSNKQDLMTNTTATKELLADVLKCAGATFLVIDGLDEVEEFERKQLLTSLIEILKACTDSNLKICISSRAEDDIVKILEPTAATVRVDKENTTGILTYVNSRFEEWMANSDSWMKGRVRSSRCYNRSVPRQGVSVFCARNSKPSCNTDLQSLIACTRHVFVCTYRHR